jgi:hypothetical protein
MMRGNRKKSGKFIYIPADTQSEALSRRSDLVKRINEVKVQQQLLVTELRDSTQELRLLNTQIRSNNYGVIHQEEGTLDENQVEE